MPDHRRTIMSSYGTPLILPSAVPLPATVRDSGDPGTIREFNEDILYLAHSLATTDEVIRPPGAREGDFIRLVDAEIEKVNRWTKRIQAELLAAVRAPRGLRFNTDAPAEAFARITTGQDVHCDG